MSGRTATWKEPVHSTFVVTVNDQVGLLTNGFHSAMRACTAYQSLTCEALRLEPPAPPESGHKRGQPGYEAPSDVHRHIVQQHADRDVAR
eukprot:7389189-Prymnesium_polylepis.1